MMKMNRRTFLKFTGVTLGWSIFGGSRTPIVSASPSADLVLKNGAIVTMREDQPLAEAMAVRAGRILSVGTNKQIDGLISHNTKVIDVAGKGVSPGFIDAHSHVIGFGQMQLKYVQLRPPKVNSFETLRNELANAAKEKPAGQWIIGRGFNEFKEGRFPRRWELDEATPDHPVLIIHWGGQFGVANTLALKKANLFRADVRDPYGGKYLRASDTGLPDGVLVHYPAIYSVYQPLLDEREQLECAAWGVEQFAREGVTCIHDNFCAPKYARAYVWLERKGKLPCRVRVYPYVPNLKHCQELINRVKRYRGRLVRLQGIKLAVDGYALMYDAPSDQHHLKIPMHPKKVFNEIVAAIHNGGFQADVHAVGDEGVDWTLEAFARAAGSTANCRKRRHRIEHFIFRKSDSISRAAEMGVPVCTQPNFIEVKADDILKKLGNGGRKLVDTLIPSRTFAKEGVRLAYGADVPAFPSHSPMESIRSAMERKTGSGMNLSSSEGVSFMEALRHHTVDGAYASFDEEEIGSLAPGKYADFVIWNKDLGIIKEGSDTVTMKPIATYLAGKAVYET